MTPVAGRRIARTVKRTFDVVMASVLLVVLAPVLAVIALLVHQRLGSPVLFRQVRPGRDGHPFVLHKFRSMTDARSPSGELLPDADRMTAFGRWLRSTSIDELPELWNVLRGDMSLVGPRPLLVEYLDLYTPQQARRHEVRPGMTGWAALHGRNDVTWEDRLALDTWYVDHWTLRLDMHILLRTVRLVLRRTGVAQRGHATVERFTGSGGTQDVRP